jgi:hypothetical protein
LIGRLEFKPVKLAWLEGSSAENEVQVSITIDIDQRRQTVIADTLVRDGHFTADEVVAELNIRTEHRGFAGDADTNEPKDGSGSASHAFHDWVSDSCWRAANFIIAAGTLQFARLDVTLALNGKIDL